MVRETYALLTGLFVLTLGGAMVMMGLFLGDYGRERDAYIVWTQGAVSGLNTESVVIYRGVEAGKVISIGFDPHDTRNILVRIELDKGLPITRGTYATLRVQPLTGLAQVELSDTGKDPTPLHTNASNPARIPLEPSLLDRLTGSGSDILTELVQLTRDLNGVISGENRTHIDHTLKMLDKAASELVVLEQRLGGVLDRVPEIDNRLTHALKAHSAAAQDVRETSGRIRELAASTAEFVALGRTAATTLVSDHLPEFKTLLDNMQQTATNLRKLSAALERDPQTLLLGPPPSTPGPGEPGYEERR